MRIVSLFGFFDERSIEPLRRHAAFIPANQQDCGSGRIEGESEAPDAARRAEAHFLQIRVLRPFKRIHKIPAEAGAMFSKDFDAGEQFDPHRSQAPPIRARNRDGKALSTAYQNIAFEL